MSQQGFVLSADPTTPAMGDPHSMYGANEKAWRRTVSWFSETSSGVRLGESQSCGSVRRSIMWREAQPNP